MTYEPLHHKYRPQTFAELVGQEAIANTLTSALNQQKIAPAYLFTGARGTGKTSSARILAKSLNCLVSKVPTAKPCGVCDVCRAIANGSALDVIEIDAASNTGVDNIRELIERAQFAPVQCRYKVYVIDECHMLSVAAFNALLKTLEEPPDRVVFVLATTDPQRVLPTIISRCQRFDFRRIGLEAMSQHLRVIADQEKIAITDDAITLVAQIAQGGLRDAESLLDQLSLLPEAVGIEQVWDLVGSVPERDLISLVQAIAQNDPEAVLDTVRRLMDRGREPLIVLQNLAGFYRDLLIAKTAPNRNDLVALTASTWVQLCQFASQLDIAVILAGQQQLRSSEVQLKNTTQPRLWLEVTLMGLLPSAMGSQAIASGQAKETRASPTPSTPPAIPDATNGHTQLPIPAKAQPVRSSVPPPPVSEAATKEASLEATHPTPPQVEPTEAIPTTAATPETSPAPTFVNGDLHQIWQQILDHLHPLSRALLNDYGCLVAFDGDHARIGIATEKLVKIAQNQVKNIEKAFLSVFKRTVKVTLEIASSPNSGTLRTEPSSHLDSAPPAPSVQSDNRKIAPAANRNHPPTPLKTEQPAQPSTEFAAPEIAANQSAATPDSQSPSWLEDEATIAAKRLAEFFAGKVIDDTDDLPVSFALPLNSNDLDLQSEDSATSEWSESEPDSEDDSSVPF